jgi:hypothetical protein
LGVSDKLTIYRDCVDVLAALCALDPPPASPEGCLLAALAAAVIEYERATRLGIFGMDDRLHDQ